MYIILTNNIIFKSKTLDARVQIHVLIPTDYDISQGTAAVLLFCNMKS